MALSQKHRIALCQHFVPDLGEDVTEALMAEFPAHDGDELVTKTYLRVELAEQTADLHSEMHRLHAQTMTTIIGVAGVMTAVLAIFN